MQLLIINNDNIAVWMDKVSEYIIIVASYSRCVSIVTNYHITYIVDGITSQQVVSVNTDHTIRV